MKIRLIGLSGVATAGKDYTYGLVKSYIPQAVRVSFADALKDDLVVLLAKDGINPYTTDPILKAKIRPLLVVYGQLMRSFDQDYWVKKAFEKVDPQKLTVITDVRFPNEVEAIHNAGGIVVYLEGGKEPANNVEATLDPWLRENSDRIVVNDMRTTDHVHEILNLIR